MKLRHSILILMVIPIFLSSCLEDILFINGNGIPATENRSSGMFFKIENSTSIDVVFIKADSTSITIKADENLLDYIITETNNNTLEIKTKNCNTMLHFKEKPLITITAPGLEEAIISGSGAFIAEEISGETIVVKMSGSGDISAVRVNGNDLFVILTGSGHININECQVKTSDLFLSGSGSISVKGVGEDNKIKITGSGEIFADDLLTGSASIFISGSGNAYANVDHSLTAIITGSGNIYLKGNPSVSQTITGSGRIIKYK